MRLLLSVVSDLRMPLTLRLRMELRESEVGERGPTAEMYPAVEAQPLLLNGLPALRLQYGSILR
jgi:hypothetical protein